MYYKVPKPTPAIERPPPLFPWEQHQAKPTRVFADDKHPSPEPSLSVNTDNDTQTGTVSPSTPTIHVTSEPFASYSRTNAWDEMPEIERYISNLPQNRRGKIQVLMNNSTTSDGILSPAIEDPSHRRPSMKLTDFPTEIERPSLPVTPAPVRRPNFWGQERNAVGDLPVAEGVPKQEDWDPMAKLAELQRRQSGLLDQGPISPMHAIPDRTLPESAAPLSLHEEDTSIQATSGTGALLSGGSSPHGMVGPVPQPKFEELDFGPRDVGRSGEDEGVFSPTEG